jgi:MraZ protein
MNKKAVVAGLFDRLEIWDEAKWNKYKASTEKKSNSIAEGLGELGV